MSGSGAGNPMAVGGASTRLVQAPFQGNVVGCCRHEWEEVLEVFTMSMLTVGVLAEAAADAQSWRYCRQPKQRYVAGLGLLAMDSWRPDVGSTAGFPDLYLGK